MKIQNNRFQELDALRGIAAMMVVLFHFTRSRVEAKYGLKLGTTGVDLFFIISGFVIYMSLTKIKTSKDFIINRVSRLYPTYWTCVTIAFLFSNLLSVLYYKNGTIPFRQYIGNMTMFQFYLKIPDIDGPYWTMIVEMIFYLSILFLFHFKIIKYLKPIGLSLIIIVPLITLFNHSNIVTKIITYIPLLQFIPLFFAGTIFYKIYTEKTDLLENYGIILLCLISQISMFWHAGRSWAVISHNEYGTMLTIYFILFTLFINDQLKGIVSRVSLFLGKISFALYLIHQKIACDYLIPTLTNKFNINFWLACLITLPIIISLAAIITLYIEVPFSQKMKAKLRSL